MNKKILVLGLTVTCLMATTAVAGNGKGKKTTALPPGLEKRQEQGKPLPPGWQKKLAVGDVLEASIYARGSVEVPLANDGSITIEVEGVSIKLYQPTLKILAILD